MGPVALGGCFFFNWLKIAHLQFSNLQRLFCSPAFSMKQAFLSGQQHGGCNRKVCCSARGGRCTFETTSAKQMSDCHDLEERMADVRRQNMYLGCVAFGGIAGKKSS